MEARASVVRLVLASASPRRRELLEGLDVEFICRPVNLDESPLPGEGPETYTRRLARAKARAKADDGEVVLAADTTVVLDGALLGKPESPAHAGEMLHSLSGRAHEVFTGVAVHVPQDGGQTATRDAVCRSRVWMASLGEEEIDWYVSTGEPLDKAGAYAIQGLGALLVERIEGNYSNIVGLPLPTAQRLLHDCGYDVRQFRRTGDGR